MLRFIVKLLCAFLCIYLLSLAENYIVTDMQATYLAKAAVKQFEPSHEAGAEARTELLVWSMDAMHVVFAIVMFLVLVLWFFDDIVCFFRGVKNE